MTNDKRANEKLAIRVIVAVGIFSFVLGAVLGAFAGVLIALLVLS